MSANGVDKIIKKFEDNEDVRSHLKLNQARKRKLVASTSVEDPQHY